MAGAKMAGVLPFAFGPTKDRLVNLGHALG